MANDRSVTHEKNLVHSFKDLVTSYQELSLYKMRLTRSAILKNREFLEELAEIFFDVKMSYVNLLASFLMYHQKNGKKQFAGVTKNGKQIDILITANAKLYGSLPTRVFDAFFKDIQLHTADLFIIGKIGRALFDAKHTGRSYAYFEIPDTASTADALSPLISHILPYERVMVYYGKYVNMLTQTPVAVSITGDKPNEEKDSAHIYRFLFEPHLEEILHFFQSQVFTSLFNQSVHEGELARHASRITSMEQAVVHIEEALKNLERQEKHMQLKLMNKKQLDLFAGMSIWDEQSYE
jgi:F0F1-type ATP synthase gamma subunit